VITFSQLPHQSTYMLTLILTILVLELQLPNLFQKQAARGCC
jgi:hypothetical protein